MSDDEAMVQPIELQRRSKYEMARYVSKVPGLLLMSDEMRAAMAEVADEAESAGELLAALKRLLAWSTSEYQSNPNIDEQARQAIARAEKRR